MSKNSYDSPYKVYPNSLHYNSRGEECMKIYVYDTPYEHGYNDQIVCTPFGRLKRKFTEHLETLKKQKEQESKRYISYAEPYKVYPNTLHINSNNEEVMEVYIYDCFDGGNVQTISTPFGSLKRKYIKHLELLKKTK